MEIQLLIKPNCQTNVQEQYQVISRDNEAENVFYSTFRSRSVHWERTTRLQSKILFYA